MDKNFFENYYVKLKIKVLIILMKIILYVNYCNILLLGVIGFWFWGGKLGGV